MMKWFRFFDSASGGSTKIPPYKIIFLQAKSLEFAIDKFQKMFERDPCHVTCDCCGVDYHISESETLLEEIDYDLDFYSMSESEFYKRDDVFIEGK